MSAAGASLVHDEQTKLTATWLNGIAVAAVAVGGIAPFAAVVVGTTSVSSARISAVPRFSFGTGLHPGARAILRRLIE